MFIAKIGMNEYVGIDDDGGFIPVEGIENAYRGVDGELDESVEILGNGEYDIIEL